HLPRGSQFVGASDQDFDVLLSLEELGRSRLHPPLEPVVTGVTSIGLDVDRFAAAREPTFMSEPSSILRSLFELSGPSSSPLSFRGWGLLLSASQRHTESAARPSVEGFGCEEGEARTPRKVASRWGSPSVPSSEGPRGSLRLP